MWYLRDFMDACSRQIIFRAAIIFLIGLLIGFIIGCDTPYTNDFLGQGVSVDDIIYDLDPYVEPGECVTDGFDWLCRGHTHVVTVEVIREIEVEVVREVEVPVEVIREVEVEVEVPFPVEVIREVEVVREVQKPVRIIEIYAVIVEPNQVIQTPVGVIQTDASGAVVSAPAGVSVTATTIPSGGRRGTPQGGGDGEHITPQDGGYVVYSHLVNGRKQSGVIHSDYVHINGDGTITFTGSDGVVDGDDVESTRTYEKIETGLTYEQASKRAPEILSE